MIGKKRVSEQEPNSLNRPQAMSFARKPKAVATVANVAVELCPPDRAIVCNAARILNG
jgi:hypothetical protein